MKKIVQVMKKSAAVFLASMLLIGCGSSENDADQIEMAPIQGNTVEKKATPTEEPSPTPTLMPTQVPLSQLVFCRPSYSIVATGSLSHADERGSFTVVEKSLIAILPVDDGAGYSWRCVDHSKDGIFTVSEGELQGYPYIYASGKYGGDETPESEVKAAEDRWKQMKAEAEKALYTPTPTPTPKPETNTGNGVTYNNGGSTVIYEYVTLPPEENTAPDQITESDDPLNGWEIDTGGVGGEGEEQDDLSGYEIEDGGDAGDDAGEVDPGVYPDDSSLVYEGEDDFVGSNGTGGGMGLMSAKMGGSKKNRTQTIPPATFAGAKLTKLSSATTPAAVKQEKVTYVYAPAREQYTFTPNTPGTDTFYLEYAKGEGTEQALDSGYILFVHADEDLAVTYDLVHYSFSTNIAAPNAISEMASELLQEDAIQQEEEAREAFDSCVRDNNTIGASAIRVEGAYWEVYSTDENIATVTSNGGAFFHEDFQDYTWDMFSINPVSPGRTTLYFYYRNGDGQPIPRMQVADVKVAEDLSLDVHVRRFDLGVEFD
ncbi:MAG: hypothetical protein Q4A32_06255 [Lachnospiraceae bacterium]|nr:hypothetical protein [Lachnospiraceae bacterium]